MLSRPVGRNGHDLQEFAGFIRDRIEAACALAKARWTDATVAVFQELREGTPVAG